MENELKYLSLIIEDLPCGDFYDNDIKIKIRSATVEEISYYSMVDPNNLGDIEEKLNQILSRNILINDKDGNIYDYKYLKSLDVDYLFFIIRELTFQSGNSLADDIVCDNCNNKFKVYYRTTTNDKHKKSIYNKKINPKLEKYFNKKDKVFELNIDGKVFKISPPTLGVKRCLDSFNEKYDNINSDIIQYLIPSNVVLKEETIFLLIMFINSLDMKSFQILKKFISMIDLGLGELKHECPLCKKEQTKSIILPNLMQTFSLFQIDLSTLIQNEFEFWWQKQMIPSELEKMPYWKYEEFVKLLNKRLEEEKKTQEEQEHHQKNNQPKTPNYKTPKIPKYN